MMFVVGVNFPPEQFELSPLGHGPDEIGEVLDVIKPGVICLTKNGIGAGCPRWSSAWTARPGLRA